MAAVRRRRQRLLPAWMRAVGDERPAVPASSRAGRRRRQRATAGPRAAAVVYCMNEAELVDMALAVLAENLQCEENEKKVQPRSEEEKELQPTPNEASGSTASTGRSRDCNVAVQSSPGAGAGANTERTGWEDSENDVLKYVREIFFS